MQSQVFKFRHLWHLYCGRLNTHVAVRRIAGTKRESAANPFSPKMALSELILPKGDDPDAENLPGNVHRPAFTSRRIEVEKTLGHLLSQRHQAETNTESLNCAAYKRRASLDHVMACTEARWLRSIKP
jgi:hypothetical protein